MAFDVEKEAEALARQLRPQPCFQEHYTERLIDFATRARQDAVEETEEEIAEYVRGWANFYPKSVFPEPPPGEHGKTRDACSASMGRRLAHIIAESIHERRRRREEKTK